MENNSLAERRTFCLHRVHHCVIIERFRFIFTAKVKRDVLPCQIKTVQNMDLVWINLT